MGVVEKGVWGQKFYNNAISIVYVKEVSKTRNVG